MNAKNNRNDRSTGVLPNFEEPEPDLEVLIAVVDREIRYRRKVYPNRIARGYLRSETAWRQINLMEAVKRRLEGLSV